MFYTDIGCMRLRRKFLRKSAGIYLWSDRYSQQKVAGWFYLIQLCEHSGFEISWALRVWRIFYKEDWQNFLYKPSIKGALKLHTHLKNFGGLKYYRRTGDLIEYSTLLTRFNNFKFQSLKSYKFTAEIYRHESNFIGGSEGHCIRVQRRYNKRRYSRARPVSRPSFWAGASFCSLSIGMFWSATMENLDWVSSQLMIVPMTGALLILGAYILSRWSWVIGSANYLRGRDLVKIQRLWKKMGKIIYYKGRWWI